MCKVFLFLCWGVFIACMLRWYVSCARVDQRRGFRAKLCTSCRRIFLLVGGILRLEHLRSHIKWTEQRLVHAYGKCGSVEAIRARNRFVCKPQCLHVLGVCSCSCTLCVCHTHTE
ncbi:hypothetical protein DUNSADRAFT_1182 [Dunaliella salina]|uniref:Encoded protein n=1 Tax=Dunaliella salina TaxID=3046 RepID=A0ABQ7FXW1_DUNSA|nr:hypothetical protein DUNSADRAFT_1182 [Dunaliella salina]|eukprot:KAF5827184.1 hypothetical protein DUNSADRAFT_1182 [Dunaliella salina]